MSITSDITRIQGAKEALKTSIEAKGVQVPAATKIDGYPALVDDIPAGGSSSGMIVTEFWPANDSVTARRNMPKAVELSDQGYGTTIRSYQFYGGGYGSAAPYFKYVQSITLPGGITSIDRDAFNFCPYLEMEIPETVASIGTYAFNSCSKLNPTKLPDGLTSVADYTFSYCDMSNITSVPPGVTSIPARFLTATKITSLNMPKVTTVANSSLDNCPYLTAVTVGSAGSAVTAIGTSAFSYDNSLLSITVYTANGLASDLTGAPWGAANATITYLQA